LHGKSITVGAFRCLTPPSRGRPAGGPPLTSNVRALMPHPNSNYDRIKWASALGTSLVSTSAFASGGGFDLGPENIAIVASAGALVGVMGVVFNIKAARLLFSSFLVAVLPLAFFFVPLSGIYGLLIAVTLAAPFVAGLAFVYGFLCLALRLFSDARQ
jgi:hypothetical protein